MKVSILITTYNRRELLRRAIASVLKQDHADFEIVVIDDASTKSMRSVVEEFKDKRIRFVRNAKNVGGEGGDIALIRKFLNEHCDGDAFVYLCDDDYWLPRDLLSRQVAALEQHPSLAFVQGGMVQCYPEPVPEIASNEQYVQYSFIDDDKKQVFWGSLYPAGFMRGVRFLELLADDPKNRNIGTGATLYRADKIRASGAVERSRDVRWQAGYAISAGAAAQGDVFYIDEPCLMVAVGIDSASHRGTQFEHMMDCLASIDAAFANVDPQSETFAIRSRMMRSICKVYLCNKISNKFDQFKATPLGDMSHVLLPEITSAEFFAAMERYGVELSDDNRTIIAHSDCPAVELQRISWDRILQMAS